MSCLGKKIIFKKECLPIDAADGVIYICEPDEVAHMKCPCGCGDLLTINLIPGTHPGWKVVGENSLIPSINRTIGCRSHFTITGGVTV